MTAKQCIRVGGPNVTADLSLYKGIKLVPVLGSSCLVLAKQDSRITKNSILQIFSTDSQAAPLDSCFQLSKAQSPNFLLNDLSENGPQYDFILCFVPDYKKMNNLNLKLSTERLRVFFQIGLTNY